MRHSRFVFYQAPCLLQLAGEGGREGEREEGREEGRERVKKEGGMRGEEESEREKGFVCAYSSL